MNTDHFRKVLLRRQDELRNETAAFRGEARQVPEGVEDFADEASSSQGKAMSLDENALASETLRQVEEALARIENGTYGKCLDCGREIETARLEAVPWARYCLEDQQRHDREGFAAAGGSTI
jgi:DnaK suppressor protein